MEYKELLLDSLDRVYERFANNYKGVTLDEGNLFPVESITPRIKSMNWLAWHTAREIDIQITHLAGHDSLWCQGWGDKYPGSHEDDPDWRHTLAEAKAVSISSIDDVMEYLVAAIAEAKDYITQLDAESLDDIIDTSWTPAVTRGARLVSIIDDAAMHSGQFVYAKRLVGLND